MNEPRKKSPGRPPLLGERMIQTAIWITPDQHKWLAQQPGTMAEIVRRLIDAEMQKG